MRGEAELARAWAGACNQNIETVRFRVGLRPDCKKIHCFAGKFFSPKLARVSPLRLPRPRAHCGLVEK